MMSDGLIRSVDKGNIINRSDFCNLCNAVILYFDLDHKRSSSENTLFLVPVFLNTVLEKWKEEN